ncbi:hypothetical protein Z517_07260 [Fonsecaea pedrosoi CBS 271.37]|uniref:J domain-containing protein n=1 Tax=Fonsecaea pedrosoi CBS 271.37 TaxID=1442368 RepID=A0A0D2H7M0_9EURO|nr:uncharacterized protein Z517_07260 [Fonsecaea pedrosoi CBS 271.37]KIW80644.1 hypothetical protein Z517_07260 [Fonsecaea pedrosoi CBS 271.37]
MVKADVKRDYYADLDLPPTADAEEIKKQFRLLAKQYHPDRNPGHEVEVVPRFQAVQAAHEILSDPVEKAKYDAGRAKLAAKAAATASTAYSSDPYGFSRPNNAKSTPTTKQQFPFPPPPKPAQNRAPFATVNPKQQASSGADKFNAFTRGVPQSWDRSKYDEARAEAARVFPTMRPTSSAQQMPPRSVPRQAPTAPKPPSSSDMPYAPNVPPTGFPGLSRTASSRKPDYHGADTSQFPRSAFSYVQGTRGQPPPPNPHIHVQDNHSMRSPPVSRARPAVSPLRHTRSSDYDMRHDLGGRPPSRYAGGGGERTDINGDGLHRSSSVRNSPIDDRGPFGRSSTRYESIPRHRSASPGMRKAGIHADFSETSSSDEETLHTNSRPKAVPRSRPTARTGPSYDADNNPGLTGQFPSTNYTRIVDDSRYQYPPPEPKESSRKPFPGVTTPEDEGPKPNVCHSGGGGSENPKYAPFFLDSQTWSRGNRRDCFAQRGRSFNGFPSWAVPSSVFPQTTPPRPHRQNGDTPGAGGGLESVQSWSKSANPSVSNDSAHPKVQTTFSAAEWHDKVTAEDIFRPDESQTRKSPSKLNRTGSKPTSRGRAQSRSAEHDPASSSEVPNGHTEDKSTAFQPGKLADDWAAKASARPAPSRNPRASPASDTTDDSRDRYVVVEEDAMDVDTPPTNNTKVPASNGVKYPASGEPPRPEPKRRSTNGGVDLKEFAQQAPFAPTSAGLKGMKDDLETFLPFESRASNDVNLNRAASARIRALNLPKPPKVVVPPAADRLDKINFAQYVSNMENYMREWNLFNARMLEHFRSRQDRVCGTMSPHWIAQPSDGPDADALDKDGASDKLAGYGAYIQWLKDDAQCRHWWEEANERHLECMEDLGKIRQVAKQKLRP